MNNQQRYQGFLNTPLLWENDAIYGLQQLSIPSRTSVFKTTNKKRLRLGKLAEQFVFHQFKVDDSYKVLSENIPIENDERTIGELDCILKHDNSPIHLEIVYKFYLYDPKVGNSELEHWIGPNRKDSLVEKLSKLKDKQLPLLHKTETKQTLDRFNVQADDCSQCVHFRAQLFVPKSYSEVNSLTNHSCIQGYYYTLDEMKSFSKSKFHIPKKLDWFVDVQVQIDWMSYEAFISKVKVLLDEKRAPMVWMKMPNGQKEKCFVVWW